MHNKMLHSNIQIWQKKVARKIQEATKVLKNRREKVLHARPNLLSWPQNGPRALPRRFTDANGKNRGRAVPVRGDALRAKERAFSPRGRLSRDPRASGGERRGTSPDRKGPPAVLPLFRGNRYGFTTFSGVPFKNALILFTVQSMIRWRLP